MIKSCENPCLDPVSASSYRFPPFHTQPLRVVYASWTCFLISWWLLKNYSTIPLKSVRSPQDGLFLNIMDKAFILLDQSAALSLWNIVCMWLCDTALSWLSFYCFWPPSWSPFVSTPCVPTHTRLLFFRVLDEFLFPFSANCFWMISATYMALFFNHMLMLLIVLSPAQTWVQKLLNSSFSLISALRQSTDTWKSTCLC